MAQIVVFGRVMHELVPKEGQSKQQYVCFDLMERSGNTPPDYYQVWARGDDVTRLMRLKVKKGSMIWLTGSQKLVDVRQKDGTTVKKLKIWLNLRWNELGDIPSELPVLDVSNIGHHGNGDYQFDISTDAEIEMLVPLIRKTYEKKAGQ